MLQSHYNVDEIWKVVQLLFFVECKTAPLNRSEIVIISKAFPGQNLNDIFRSKGITSRATNESVAIYVRFHSRVNITSLEATLTNHDKLNVELYDNAGKLIPRKVNTIQKNTRVSIWTALTAVHLSLKYQIVYVLLISVELNLILKYMWILFIYVTRTYLVFLSLLICLNRFQIIHLNENIINWDAMHIIENRILEIYW